MIAGMSEADVFPNETLDERLPDAPLNERLPDVPVDVAVPKLAADEGDTVIFVKPELSGAPFEFGILARLSSEIRSARIVNR